MADERMIPRKPLVWMAKAATPTVWTAIEGYVKEIAIKGKRGKIDARGYSDGGAREEKLDPENEAMIKLFHSRAWSLFSALMVTELNAETSTGFRVKYRGTVATGVDNPIFEFWFKWTEIGTIGGEVNTLSMADFSVPIEGMVKISTDGTTFTDYF